MNLILRRALNQAKNLPDVSHLYKKIKGETIWEKVVRERKEGNYKYLGGNYRKWKKYIKKNIFDIGE